MNTLSHASRIELIPLSPDLLEPAVQLFAANYGDARRRQPLLPAAHTGAAKVVERLARLIARELGVAAVRNGQLVGYAVGCLMADWHGWRTACMPEWAHASVAQERGNIYCAMYEHLSRQWAADGRKCHIVCMLADSAPLETWFSLGFGLFGIDAVRDMSSAQAPPTPPEIRRAGPDDAEIVAELITRLREHLADAPTFLPAQGPARPEEQAVLLADPKQAVCLAFDGGHAVGLIQATAANPRASWVIGDPGTASMVAAYTRPACRSRGVASALLNEAVGWARAAGYQRCAVDFETFNTCGRRFWLRHFSMVACAAARAIRS